jgi:arsenate reductase (thioredoxin)
MIDVLFVCIHNSARSQMAEAYLNAYGKGLFKAESAGLEPGRLNPNVVKVMALDGIDISNNTTKSTFDMLKKGTRYTYVVTVCDEASGQRCPFFPGVLKTFHWNIEDPSALKGDYDVILPELLKIRDEVKTRVKQFILEFEAYAQSRK